MALRHVVLLKFQKSVSDEQKQALEDGLAKLPLVIPEILAYNFGQDAHLDPERNHDFAIIGDFASDEDYAVYAKHPAHLEVIQNLVKPILAPGGRTAVQFRSAVCDSGGSLSSFPALHAFQHKLRTGNKDSFVFQDTLALVEQYFDYTPRKFINGGAENAAGTNEGSCKVFSMGKLLGWSEQEVLASFGEHYRQVLGDPDGSSHANIRAFIKQGWAGVQFPDGLGLAANGLNAFREKLRCGPASLVFKDTLSMIDAHFDYTPKKFCNGDTENAAGTNEGSCKVFSMGKLLGLSEKEVLLAFGEHYRQVLGDPDGSSHGNIRAFMKQGWAGVKLPDGLALSAGPASKRQKTK